MLNRIKRIKPERLPECCIRWIESTTETQCWRCREPWRVYQGMWLFRDRSKLIVCPRCQWRVCPDLAEGLSYTRFMVSKLTHLGTFEPWP
jgi:hypothetical protein